MVKGISRQVVVVKAPLGSIFDEAIFILRNSPTSPDIDSEKILREACLAADEYVRKNCRERQHNKIIWLIGISAALIIISLFLFLVFK